MSETKKSAPKHRARATLVTKHRERVAEREHHMWAAQGLDRPTHRGRHASNAPVYRDAEQPAAVSA